MACAGDPRAAHGAGLSDRREPRRDADRHALLAARQEYDYPIPVADAERMLRDFCNGVVEKVRHYVPHAGLMFEVDEFLGDNADLVVAEVELQSADQAIAKPEWLGREVSEHLRYYNLNLLQYPYSRWSERERAGE